VDDAFVEPERPVTLRLDEDPVVAVVAVAARLLVGLGEVGEQVSPPAVADLGVPAHHVDPRALVLAPAGLEALLSLDRDALFFLFRIVWGIVGPLALSWFIWRTAEMKSNQAATGLLYVALVFVLIGELLAAYLTVATGFPA
jgi:hypothetical protein